jgi:MoaA/NifB/PqqE/SkfB family radical SAM enzyme
MGEDVADRARWIYRRLYEGVQHRLATAAGGRWAGHCRPTWVDFMLTARCNARCVHCDIWQNRGREETPSAEEWTRALSEVRTWLGPTRVGITGGEALLRPYAPELAAHGSAIGLFIEFLTNGYWKDQSRVERLARANPWRVTLSLDGLGETHDRVRGRSGFFEKTTTTVGTLKRIRAERKLGFGILLKTVLMSHNLDDACALAEYAAREGLEICYQPIEQNYDTPEDPLWFLSSGNWPADPDRAVAVVEDLLRLKRAGLPITNSTTQLEVMIPYFRDPAAWQVSTQAHTAHARKAGCAALGLIQVHANGDVKVCSAAPPVGNIREAGLREIWEGRPRWWEGGCCLERRLSAAERENPQFVQRPETSAERSPAG